MAQQNNTPEDRTNEAVRAEWIRPEVRRMAAGDAELNPAAAADGLGAGMS